MGMNYQAQCAGVSVTGPRNPHGHPDRLVGVSELNRWPNSWGQIMRIPISRPINEQIGEREILSHSHFLMQHPSRAFIGDL